MFFLEFLRILVVMKIEKKFLLFKKIRNYNTVPLSETKKCHMTSVAEIRNASQNVGAEILNNLKSVINVFKERHTWNLIRTKFG